MQLGDVLAISAVTQVLPTSLLLLNNGCEKRGTLRGDRVNCKLNGLVTISSFNGLKFVVLYGLSFRF